jgi:ADP-ribose pyrophosphatase YjhB (NUDIX family)
MGESSRSARANNEALAVVLQVRGGGLQVLLWQRAREPFNGAWALPGGMLGATETLEASIRRHLNASREWLRGLVEKGHGQVS